MYSITDSISDSKEFSFSGVDVGNIINSFGNNFLISVNIRDWSDNVIFNIYVCYDEYIILLYKWFFLYVV